MLMVQCSVGGSHRKGEDDLQVKQGFKNWCRQRRIKYTLYIMLTFLMVLYVVYRVNPHMRVKKLTIFMCFMTRLLISVQLYS